MKLLFRTWQTADKAISARPIGSMDGFNRFSDPIAHGHFTNLKGHDEG